MQKGFTLIELIVVIVILGILAAVAVPQFIDFSKDARIARLESVRAALLVGLELFEVDYRLELANSPNNRQTGDRKKYRESYKYNGGFGINHVLKGGEKSIKLACGQPMKIQGGLVPHYARIDTSDLVVGDEIVYDKTAEDSDNCRIVFERKGCGGAKLGDPPTRKMELITSGC